MRLAWLRNPKVAANLSREKVFYFTVARHCGGCAGAWVEIDGVAAAFTQQFTSQSRKMANEITPLHSTIVKN